MKTYFLANITQQNDANEILIALRNVSRPLMPRCTSSTPTNAIVIAAPPDQQAVAQKLITELDRPKKSYRLTFTLADSDSGKRVGIQHFSIVVADGQRTVIKQGDKIPVVTGTYEKRRRHRNTDAVPIPRHRPQLRRDPHRLARGTLPQIQGRGNPASASPAPSPASRSPSSARPSLEGTSEMTPGKPLTLGSLDIEGTTRHIDIEVVAEPIS